MNIRVYIYLTSFFILYLGACQTKNVEDDTPLKTQLTEEQLSLLRPGDIILRRGDGSLSTQIIKMMEEDNNISHCGIVALQDNEWKVIHALGGPTSETDGVQVENLQSFVGKTLDNTIFISRPIFADSLDYWIPYYAYQYAEQQIPFDYYFNLESDDSFGCTEFIYKVFKKITPQEIFEIEDKRGLLLLHFTTFFDTTKFEEIIDLRDRKSGYEVY